MNLIEQLENFIKTTKSELELKRALAAKMAIEKKHYRAANFFKFLKAL